MPVGDHFKPPFFIHYPHVDGDILIAVISEEEYRSLFQYIHMNKNEEREIVVVVIGAVDSGDNPFSTRSVTLVTPD